MKVSGGAAATTDTTVTAVAAETQVEQKGRKNITEKNREESRTPRPSPEQCKQLKWMFRNRCLGLRSTSWTPSYGTVRPALPSVFGVSPVYYLCMLPGDCGRAYDDAVKRRELRYKTM